MQRKRPSLLADRFKTMSVPEAGAHFGLSMSGSYKAAARGELATVRIGAKLRVPVAFVERKFAKALKGLDEK